MLRKQFKIQGKILLHISQVEHWKCTISKNILLQTTFLMCTTEILAKCDIVKPVCLLWEIPCIGFFLLAKYTIFPSIPRCILGKLHAKGAPGNVVHQNLLPYRHIPVGGHRGQCSPNQKIFHGFAPSP